MSTATEIKKTYNKQQKTQKLLHTIFIISICLMIAAVLCIIISYDLFLLLCKDEKRDSGSLYGGKHSSSASALEHLLEEYSTRID